MVVESFAYTGAEQTWEVPAGITEVTIEAWGADGGAGGRRGYATGKLAVTPGETLRIYVGGVGAAGVGGYNGGGDSDPTVYGGGGASDVRQGGATLADRVLVAGGGGGRGNSGADAGGGSNGATGADGSGTFFGGGGTQVAGGAGGGSGSPSGDSGALGVGGAGGGFGNTDGGGGGGGYYGGGGGGSNSFSQGGGGGGGGSCYIGGVTDGSMSGDSGASAGDDGVVTITYNEAPNAPTLESPSAGQSIDRTAGRVFSWTFNDDDDGDSQSQYQIQIRHLGGATVVDVTDETPTPSHTLEGNTLPAEGDYEWRVRTWDSAGADGPWSSWRQLTAVEPPAAPTITAPLAGATISAENFTVTWSAVEQDAYQLRRVADDGGGSPDTGTVYFDSGVVATTGSRSRVVSFETNGRVEHVQVRVRSKGLWSLWASVDVDVDYTPPPDPTAIVAADVPPGAVTISAVFDEPVDPEPAVIFFDVWRRVTSEGGDGVRIASDLAPAASFKDWHVASGWDYEYRVRLWGNNGVSSWSAWEA